MSAVPVETGPLADAQRPQLRDLQAAPDAAADPLYRAAVDPATGRLVGSVVVARPGERLGPAARAGERGFGVLRVGGGSEDAGGRLLADVVALARRRYSPAAVVDLGPEAPWLRAAVVAAGFRPAPDRGEHVHLLDLTLAADGTPTRLLGNPSLAALNSHHARFAERRGEVSRYQPDVSPWLGIPDEPSDRDWDDIAELLGPGAPLFVTSGEVAPPAGWTFAGEGGGVQMSGEAVAGRPDPELVELTAQDVPEILDHIERTRPGPYLPRTVEMGRYLGVRHDGRLVAVGGERLHLPGWTEISAVSTDPEFRGRGLATRIVLAVAHGIRERGETPFLHAAAENTNAIRLYERLGFRLRSRSTMRVFTTPEPAAQAAT